MHGSREYEETVALRDDVLRRPLGLIFSPEDLSAEVDDFHLTCYDDEGNLLGCLVLTIEGEQRVRMRQVAVRPDLQRSGIGTSLIQYSEGFALAHGFTQMTTHARHRAIPFYLRLGYVPYGEPFEEVTIPHRKLRKELMKD
ncbi:MAG: GNAT family N-acetyltransferase [Chlorobi bacterium]|nr:GNAT family N-acetyltransferase [Chlorobiota bacterium]